MNYEELIQKEVESINQWARNDEGYQNAKSYLQAIGYLEEFRASLDYRGAAQAGGTYSSYELRRALRLEEVLKNASQPVSSLHQQSARSLLLYTRKLQVLWRLCLQKYNHQDLRFATYDLQTGLHEDGSLPADPLVLDMGKQN